MNDIAVPIWDITKSQTMGFAAVKPKIEDYAIDIGRGSSLGYYLRCIPQPSSLLVLGHIPNLFTLDCGT